jgi:hypothetical protein
MVTSDNSHYSIIKEPKLLSTRCRNFNARKCSSAQVSPLNIVAGVGGGEGIRTPDPRVANAVLCQLSYAP